MLAAAPVYARAHPRRGRPRTPAWRKGAVVGGAGNQRGAVTAPRSLIDENLRLPWWSRAAARVFEAMHVNYLGLRTETDWDLLNVVAEQAGCW